jgi:putative MATE family efflux protein
VSVRQRLRRLLSVFPAALAAAGVLDRRKGEEAFDLALPVMVTGGLRTALRIADFLMVGLAVGEAAIAGLEIGFQYYFIAFGLSLALSSGTISLVSRHAGAGRPAAADFAVKQSLWLALLVSIPIALLTWVHAEVMISLLTDDSRTVALGGTYLRIVMLSAPLRFWSMIAARALAGAGDTRTPMYVRLATLPTNVSLNAALIFGLWGFPQLGVAGAAIGTALANALAAVVFLGLLLSGRQAVRLRLGGTQWDGTTARELIRVGLPLAGTRLARTLGRFPFLFVLGVLGTSSVAAYAIGRRVMLLAMMPAWGYATASSTLVGQHVGAGEARLASEYGWQVLRIALATQLLIGAGLALAARPIALAFDTPQVSLTVGFIRVFGLCVAGFAVSRTMRGSLRGAGDTTWPLYGTVLGTYVVRLPIAALALPAGYTLSIGGWGAFGFEAPALELAVGLGLGIPAIYAAIVASYYVKAIVNLLRFRSGAWRRVARRSEAGAADD